MVQSKQELYGLVSDCITWNVFEDQIQSRYLQYGKLFDEDTIALLIVDELGRNNQSTLSISDLHTGLECNIVGTITFIESLRTFKRKNGNNGRFVRLNIADETGSSILVLWNDDTTLVESKEINVGSSVKIINGYTKKGYHGVEIHAGQWSIIELLKDTSYDKTKVLKTTHCIQESMVCGQIRTIEPTRVFFKDDGRYGFVTTISQVDIRTKDGVIEYHVNGKAAIKKT